MTEKTINDFTLISVLNSGDFVVVWDTSEGKTNKASMLQIRQNVLSGITLDDISDGSTYVKSENNFTDEDKSAITANSAKVSFPEAPVDGDQYARKDGSWVKSENNFTDEDKSAITANSAKVSFPEAPVDGDQYARKDGSWVKVTASGVNSFSVLVSSANTTGTSGQVGRRITLNNTTLTKTAGLMVFKSSQYVHEALISVNHLSSNTTITFTSVPITNGELISVIYYDA